MTLRHLTLMAAAVVSSAAARAADAECTVTVEACGTLEQKLSPLTKIKEGLCIRADLATIGKKPQGVHYNAVVWIGASVSGDTLVFGQGEARTGIAISCVWNLDAPKPEQQIATLKAALPQLLKDEKVRKQFPGVKSIDASKLKEIEAASKPCREAVGEFCKVK